MSSGWSPDVVTITQKKKLQNIFFFIPPAIKNPRGAILPSGARFAESSGRLLEAQHSGSLLDVAAGYLRLNM
jgi:hypothetical protein